MMTCDSNSVIGPLCTVTAAQTGGNLCLRLIKQNCNTCVSCSEESTFIHQYFILKMALEAIAHRKTQISQFVLPSVRVSGGGQQVN